MVGLSDNLEGQWKTIMSVLMPYRGSRISVPLVEDISAVRVFPEAPVEYFADICLKLPFEEWDGLHLGTVHTTQFSEYRPGVLGQIKHQTGLRLERLAREFCIEFSSPLLGYSHRLVTPAVCAQLINPNLPKTLDCIHDPWSNELFTDLRKVSEALDARLKEYQ